MEMVLVGLVFLAAFNSWVSSRIMQDDLSTKSQRTAQVAFVWLVPLLGALLALHLLKKEPEPSSGPILSLRMPATTTVTLAPITRNFGVRLIPISTHLADQLMARTTNSVWAPKCQSLTTCSASSDDRYRDNGNHWLQPLRVGNDQSRP